MSEIQQRKSHVSVSVGAGATSEELSEQYFGTADLSISQRLFLNGPDASDVFFVGPRVDFSYSRIAAYSRSDDERAHILRAIAGYHHLNHLA